MTKATRRLAAVTLTLGLFACLGPFGADRPPVQGWWAERGPVVPHDSFPADCGLCHTGEDWSRLREDFSFDHLAETGVALEGAHARAECLRCHNDRGPVQVFAARGCAGCHVDPHEGQQGAECASCHTPQDWRVPEAVALHAQTRFPLIGAHAATPCFRCHAGAETGRFEPVDVECLSCHADELELAQDPDHEALGWVNRCDRCHRPTTWGGDGFAHDFFPLRGGHALDECAACHESGATTPPPSDCFACHADDYSDADPDHRDAGFGTSCADCHTIQDWEGARFLHRGITDGCVDCHLDDRPRDAEPDHLAPGFSTACEDCHVTRTWEGATFLHRGIVDGCAECHLDDRPADADPDHFAPRFSTACEDCHMTRTWEGAVFAHRGISRGCVECHLDDTPVGGDPDHAVAGFPAACETCHETRTWFGASFVHGGISSGCTVCHSDDVPRGGDPDHAVAGFPRTCETCHQTNTWIGADFEHGRIMNACSTCHLDDRPVNENPDHFQRGFPTACEECHGTRNWRAATFDHSFPLFGDHGDLSCLDCHPSPRMPSLFSCTSCHEHSRREMDDEHDDVGGYVYSDPACLNCHPSGRR